MELARLIHDLRVNGYGPADITNEHTTSLSLRWEIKENETGLKIFVNKEFYEIGSFLSPRQSYTSKPWVCLGK